MTIEEQYPERAEEIKELVGPNMYRCLCTFTTTSAMSRATGIAASSLSHLMNGRGPKNNLTAERMEIAARNCIDLRNKSESEPEALPAEPEALPAEPEKVLLMVAVMPHQMSKTMKLLNLVDAEVVEID
jgi:hypothetical protein